jgi:dihydrofolate reductase
MRKVILQEFVTLDGLVAGRNGSVDFVPAATRGDRSFGSSQLDFIDTIDTMLLGRITYEMFADYWPNVTEGDDKPFADKLNAMHKIVFSKTLERAPWGEWPDAKIVTGNVPQQITGLKQQPGKHMIVWGSISLAESLIRERLIDEYQLVFCPLVLGEGRQLFDGLESFDLKLSAASTFNRGAALLKYFPAAAV